MKELRKTYIQVTEEEDRLIDNFTAFCENCYSRIEDPILSDLFLDIKHTIQEISKYYDYNEFDNSTELVNDFNPLENFAINNDTYSEDISVE